jgi:hypothetical protein
MIDNLVYVYFIEYGQFSSFCILSEGKANREEERDKEIDWHMYIYIELRSFSPAPSFFLYVNIIYYDVSFANSLSIRPFFPIAKRSEYMLRCLMIILHNIIQMM